VRRSPYLSALSDEPAGQPQAATIYRMKDCAGGSRHNIVCAKVVYRPHGFVQARAEGSLRGQLRPAASSRARTFSARSVGVNGLCRKVVLDRRTGRSTPESSP
jgi:hypothetical protein